MAIFQTKKEIKEVPTVKAKKIAKTAGSVSSGKSFSHVSSIVRPRITEKASMLSESSVYVFEVSKDSTKRQIALAIKELYGKVPEKIAIVKNPSKKVFRRGKVGYTSAVKKAYVHLAKGEKIEVM